MISGPVSQIILPGDDPNPPTQLLLQGLPVGPAIRNPQLAKVIMAWLQESNLAEAAEKADQLQRDHQTEDLAETWGKTQNIQSLATLEEMAERRQKWGLPYYHGWLRGLFPRLVDRIRELQNRNRRLKDKLKTSQAANYQLKERVAELETARDSWKERFHHEDDMNVQLIQQVEQLSHSRCEDESCPCEDHVLDLTHE
jgi:DNA repair exonuclease SbcCD ATPase subunit